MVGIICAMANIALLIINFSSGSYGAACFSSFAAGACLAFGIVMLTDN